MALKLFYITNNDEIAKIADRAGVDRIWIDLETLGKEERQKGLNTVKSKHSISDIHRIKAVLNNAEMLVRVNPWNKDSKAEIDKVVEAGADVIMLPMWKTIEEVESFIKAVNKRVKTLLLLETKEAEHILDDVLKLEGIDEIHIGLNDLHLSYNLAFMFELLTNGTVERIVRKIDCAGIPYGFGGISHLGDGMIPAEMIIQEHYRLGSTRAILSRGFCDQTKPIQEFEEAFNLNMKKLREFEESIKDKDLESNRRILIEKVKMVVNIIKEGKQNG